MLREMAVNENQDQSDAQEYMDLDEFFTALQDYNSITPFGKPQQHSKTGSDRKSSVKTPAHSPVIRSQLRIGRLVLDSFDGCPCAGKENSKSEDEDSLRTSVYDSILVNHLLSLLPTQAKQRGKQGKEEKVITLEPS
jgi:hypothetical protein